MKSNCNNYLNVYKNIQKNSNISHDENTFQSMANNQYFNNLNLNKSHSYFINNNSNHIQNSSNFEDNIVYYSQIPDSQNLSNN